MDEDVQTTRVNKLTFDGRDHGFQCKCRKCALPSLSLISSNELKESFLEKITGVSSVAYLMGVS